MNWKFIKSNWFTIALAILVLVAIARKNIAFPFIGSPVKKAQIEKFTDAHPKEENSSLLGLLSGSDKHSQVAMPEVQSEKGGPFLLRFTNVAVSEQKKFGIPASVILASAYVNSFAGQRETSTGANNYFALPCGDGWEGETATSDGRCVRKYETAWASYRDFSIYLSSQEWFGSLRKSAGKDWQKWAEGLNSKGISDVKDFGKEMGKVIETYGLDRLDGKK